MSITRLGLHPFNTKIFHNILKHNRLAHAYLFYGKEENKRKVAIAFAQAINCPVMPDDACERCATCKTIQHGNHPEVVSIQPEGSWIKIDQLRELRKKFHYQAPSNVTRIVIIEQAEKMRIEAANSLLKFLEEPPSPMVAILLTEQLDLILPTIQSRCQKIRFFQNLTQDRIRQYEQKGFNQFATLAVQLNIHLDMTAEELKELCKQSTLLADQILSNQIDNAFLTALSWSQSYSSDTIVCLLDLLLFWLNEILYYQSTETHKFFSDWSSLVQTQAIKHSQQRLILVIENVMIARRLLERPQFRLQEVLEQMILAIRDRKLSHKNGWQLITI